MKLVNIHTNEKCAVCGSGLCLSNLEDNPYTCEVCSFSFYRKTPIYIDAFPEKEQKEWD